MYYFFEIFYSFSFSRYALYEHKSVQSYEKEKI